MPILYTDASGVSRGLRKFYADTTAVKLAWYTDSTGTPQLVFRNYDFSLPSSYTRIYNYNSPVGSPTDGTGLTLYMYGTPTTNFARYTTFYSPHSSGNSIVLDDDSPGAWVAPYALGLYVKAVIQSSSGAGVLTSNNVPTYTLIGNYPNIYFIQLFVGINDSGLGLKTVSLTATIYFSLTPDDNGIIATVPVSLTINQANN